MSALLSDGLSLCEEVEGPQGQTQTGKRVNRKGSMGERWIEEVIVES